MVARNILNTTLVGQTGTGLFVGSGSPTLVTPIVGAANATSFTFGTTTEVVGTATNDSAPVGSVGEFVSSTVLVGSAVSTTNGAQTDITTISLTAGDWDCWGSVCTTPDVSTMTNRVAGWVNNSSASFPTAPAGGAAVYMYTGVGLAGQINYFPIGRRRFSLSSTTTIYLTASINFAISTLSVYGFIGARRVR